MKLENSTEQLDVLTIWLGQLLIFGLKADEHDLALLRHVFNDRICSLLQTENSTIIQNAICKSSDSLCNIMGHRFSWQKEGIDLLASKTKSFFIAFEFGQDYITPLTNLRVVDAWSGLSSCFNEHIPMPLSLLDYMLDIILPVLSSDLIPHLCSEIDQLFVEPLSEYDTSKVENILADIAKRVCFNSLLDSHVMNELCLAILIHLPKKNKDFSLKTGYLYKILQAKFAHEER